MLNLLKAVLREVYPASGFDRVNIKSPYNQNLYYGKWSVILASFIGLPNAKPATKVMMPSNQNSQQYPVIDVSVERINIWKNLFENYFGYQPNRNGLVTLGRGLFYGIWHTIQLPFSWVKNILKLVTEVLPLFIYKALLVKAEELGNSRDLKHPRVAEVLFFSAQLFHLLYLIGRAITSPVTSVQTAWATARNYRKQPTWKTYLLTGLSVAITATVYTLLFPLAAQFIAGLLFPLAAQFIAVHVLPVVPATIVNVATVAYQFAASLFAPLGQTIQSFVGFLANVSPEVVGFFTFLGIALPAKPALKTIGSAMFHTASNIINAVLVKRKGDYSSSGSDSDNEYRNTNNSSHSGSNPYKSTVFSGNNNNNDVNTSNDDYGYDPHTSLSIQSDANSSFSRTDEITDPTIRRDIDGHPIPQYSNHQATSTSTNSNFFSGPNTTFGGGDFEPSSTNAPDLT